MLLRDRFTFDTLWSSLGIALYKSGPLLLTVILLWRHHGELFGSYSNPAWTRE
jgi:hypothetical protein